MKVRLQISYDGTGFAGWQKQGENSLDLRPTLQASLEEAISKIFNTTMTVQASGRTDAGVHAEAQNLHFVVPKDPITQAPIKNPADMNIVRALNALTPKSIAVQKAWLAPNHFHALHSAEKKTYRFEVYNAQTPNPIKNRYTIWIKNPLDIDKLNGLCECLIGEHDFKSFQTGGTDIKSTVRTIYEARWQKLSDTQITFRITGSGFLKQMVRNIVGTTLYLHQNGFDPTEMKKILNACDRTAAKDTAPPEGLFLEKVYYPVELDNECREL